MKTVDAHSYWKDVLWLQFAAAIDMLENAMRACPDTLWSDRARRPEFWYVAYHALFWLDLYLSDSAEEFAPPPPFTLDELDPTGVLPERVYTKNELQRYLDHGRNKCRSFIGSLTEEKARAHRRYAWMNGSVAEVLLYTMRHVQHHAAQLGLILRQTVDTAPQWVVRGGR